MKGNDMNMSAKDKALKERCEVFYAGLQRRLARNIGGTPAEELFQFVQAELSKVKTKVLEPLS